MASIPLASQFYVSDAVQFSSQRIINAYIEAAPASGEVRSRFLIRGTPGSTALTSIDSGPIRGMRAVGERLFAVSNNSFYSVATTGVATNYGVLQLSQQYVDIIEGPNELLLCCGVKAYVFNLTANTLTQVSDGDFPGATSGLFMDGSAITIKPTSAQCNISDIDDFTAWDALAFTNETTVPNNILAVRDDRKEFWMFGQKVIVPYTRTGSGNFPYQRVTQSVMDMGCVAQWSIAVSDNSYFWLGQRSQEGGYAVWRAAGYTPVRISTHAIEGQIESFPASVISGAIAFTYMMKGHIMYVLNFIGYATFVYDGATGMWHEWNRYLEFWSTYTHHAVFNGNHVVGGADGRLYTLSPDVYADGNLPIIREMVTPVYSADGRPLAITRVELEAEAGVGLTTGQGAAPEIMLQWSQDGGETYGKEYWRTPGAKGVYGSRMIWRNLGRSYEWCLKFRCSDPVQFAVMGAYAETGA